MILNSTINRKSVDIVGVMFYKWLVLSTLVCALTLSLRICYYYSFYLLENVRSRQFFLPHCTNILLGKKANSRGIV